MHVPVVQDILSANDQIARENQAVFRAAGVLVLNLMSAPGAGKTSLILATAERLPPAWRLGAIEGDLASSLDAERLASHGLPVVQINTGGGCHLDAPMVRTALSHLPLSTLDVLCIENVGNLVCPANFALGADLAIVVASIPEGHDKPYKYPAMFACADAVILNKIDLLGRLDFDLQYFQRGLSMLQPQVPLFQVSCQTGEGVQPWVDWLLHRLNQHSA